MSIRPVDLSGMIQRTQDIGNIKHAEDSRPIVDQYNIDRGTASLPAGSACPDVPSLSGRTGSGTRRRCRGCRTQSAIS